MQMQKTNIACGVVMPKEEIP